MDYFYNESYSSRKKISEALEMPESTVNGVITCLKNANIIKKLLDILEIRSLYLKNM